MLLTALPRRMTGAPRVLQLASHLRGASAIAITDRPDPLRAMAPPAFPTAHLVPRTPTAAHKMPGEADGRGVVVAILDTGVDPAAAGMREGPRGGKKVVDVVDCSGSGDVPLSGPVTPGDDGTLPGPSGRPLKINPGWSNPSGTFFVGYKRGYEVFPQNLVAKSKKERRDAFEKQHHALATRVAAELADFDAQKEDAEKEKEAAVGKGLTKAERVQDYKDRLEALKDMMAKFDDPGPVFDCVVWDDGEKWVAVVDIAESGDLSDQPVLASYHVAQQYLVLPSLLTLSITIYPPHLPSAPPTLSLVTLAGAHGTHVAGITAAYHSDDSGENGVAPAAEIVSLKIGDTRLGSMETGQALTRAISYLTNPLPFRPTSRTDVANLSYGEPTSLPSLGAIPTLLRALTNAHTTFLASAGNNGPGLTTVGAPGGTAAGVIGVGAWVTGGMMRAGYGLFGDVLPEGDEVGKVYTWSSRGPAPDGWSGVGVYAPGGAVTCVPRYNLAPTQLMNGTSMSSPNASGGTALLLSSLRQAGISWTPYSVRRALENTANPVNDEFMKGIVDLPRALEWLKGLEREPHGLSPYDLDYPVTFPEIPSALGPGNAARGLYIRSPNPVPVHTSVAIGVVWPGDVADPGNANWNGMKAAMDLRIRLECGARSSHVADAQDADAAAPDWVRHPDHVALNGGGKTFPIRVDPTGLPPGLHVAEIRGSIDGDSRGPLFRIPIAVVKPVPVPDDGTVRFPGLKFSPGTVIRRFVAAPPHANFATLVLRPRPRDAPARIVVQLGQGGPGIPQTRAERNETEYAVVVGGDGEPPVVQRHFRVAASQVLEVCLAQFWSSPGETEMDVDVEFRGIWVSGGAGVAGTANVGGGGLWVNGGTGPLAARVEVWSPMRKERINLNPSFDTLRKTVALNKDLSSIVPLGSRDVHPSGKQMHALNLVYEPKVPATDSGSVTFHFPWITDLLYDSPFDGFLCMIHDWARKLVATRDVYPKAVQLPKQGGEYTVRAQVLSTDVSALDRILKEGWPMMMDLKVKEVKPGVYPGAAGTLVAGSKGGFGDRVIAKGERRVVFLSGIAADGMPKEAAPGDVLVGELKVWAGPAGTTDNGNVGIDGGLVGISMVVPAEGPKSKSENGKPKEEKDEATQLREAVRDVEIGMIAKLKDVARRNELVRKLEESFPDHLPLLAAKLDALQAAAVGEAENAAKAEPFDVEKAASANGELQRAVELAERIIGLANGTVRKSGDADAAGPGQNELALYYAGKSDTSTDAAKQIKKDMDQRKDAMVSAMLKRVQILKAAAELEETAVRAGGAPADKNPFDELVAAWLEYSKWADGAGSPEKDSKMVSLHVWRQRRRGALGSALKVLNKYLDEPPAGDCTRSSKGSAIKGLAELRIELLKETFGTEGNPWPEVEGAQLLARYPKDYTPF
ncbi:subtilase family-domain-containing protein, partial [Hyaloraphidium curvatum]